MNKKFPNPTTRKLNTHSKVNPFKSSFKDKIEQLRERRTHTTDNKSFLGRAARMGGIFVLSSLSLFLSSASPQSSNKSYEKGKENRVISQSDSLKYSTTYTLVGNIYSSNGTLIETHTKDLEIGIDFKTIKKRENDRAEFYYMLWERAKELSRERNESIRIEVIEETREVFIKGNEKDYSVLTSSPLSVMEVDPPSYP